MLAIGCLAFARPRAAVLFFPPLFADDAVHRAMLDGPRPGGPALGVRSSLTSSSAERDIPLPPCGESWGPLPWFTADDLRLRFFRPLSSATLAADERLFGPLTWPGRLHSPPRLSLGLLCIVSAIHLSMPVVAVGSVWRPWCSPWRARTRCRFPWMAARHVLVSSACALLAFWLHLRLPPGWTSSGRRWLSVITFVAGLGAGEMALGRWALIAALRAGPPGVADPLSGFAAANAPAASIAALYLGGYVVNGYGAHASGGYIRPRERHPGRTRRHPAVLDPGRRTGDGLAVRRADSLFTTVQTWRPSQRGVRARRRGPPQGVLAAGRRERSRGGGVDGRRECAGGDPRQLRHARRPGAGPRAGACERRPGDRARCGMACGAHPRAAPARPRVP